MCKDCGCGSTHTDVFVIPVTGMHCGNCTAAVEKAVLGLPGVVSATASLDDHNVTVHADGHQVTVDALRKAIDDIGFEAGESVTHEPHSHGGVGAFVKKLFK